MIFAICIWIVMLGFYKVIPGSLIPVRADNILKELDARITPVVWLFIFLLISSILISVFNIGPASVTSIPKHSPHSVDLDKNRPNIIIVIMDTLTARDMQLYGYHRATTPFISEWAEEAAVFSQSYSSANWTPPGTMSIMTGQRPWTHRVWYSVLDYPVGSHKDNLPGVLRDNGYDVYGFVQNPFASPHSLGIQSSFMKSDNYRVFGISHGDDWWLKRLSRIFKNRPIVQNWIFFDNPIARKINSYNRQPEIHTTLKPPEKVYDSFLEHISVVSNTDKNDSRPPFFAYLHVMPPQEAYLPTKPYMGIFGDADKYNSNNNQYRNFKFGQPYGPEKQDEVDILRKRYDEFILYSDQKFMEFLSNLTRTIDMNNTIIILSSDHGESFSHGWLAHDGPPMHESLIHVPLIIKRPGMTENRTIDIPVGQIDIAPTVLELAGIPVPEWMEGRSLVPLMEGRQREPYPVFSMYLQKNRVFDPITKGTIAVREGDYKLINYLQDNKTLLFNIKSDPDELIDIALEQPEITERLKKLIDDTLAQANKKAERSRN